MLAVIESGAFSSWIGGLRDAKGRARIVARIERIRISEQFGDCAGVGEAVTEMRIHFGPGYRVYFCRRGAEVVILLGGGDKSSQSRDIAAAQQLAKEYCPMPESRPFDVQNYLSTPEDRAAFLEAILEEGDPTLIAAGLGEIAKAVGVSEFSRQTGISRETIYKGLVPGGNPTLDTLTKAAKGLGLRLTVAPAA